MSEADSLFSKTFARSILAWGDIYSLRKVARYGLPHATPRLAAENEAFLRGIVSDPVFNRHIPDRDRFLDTAKATRVPEQMTQNAIAAFEASIDAASLVFGHSILDGIAMDYLRACALHSPTDWLPVIGKRKVSLERVSESNVQDLLATEIQEHVRTFEQESLLKKLDTLFLLCRPPAQYSPLRDYTYDRGRIADLDELRHDYVHRKGPGRRLPNGDSDIWYLQQTSMFLMPLVFDHYKMVINPVDMLDASSAKKLHSAG